MIRQFKDYAEGLIKEISLEAKLKEADVLLWVYFNLYFYHHENNPGYGRERFLILLQINPGFQEKYTTYEKISFRHYVRLAEAVLKNFSFLPQEGKIQLDLKEMEAYYEELLHKSHRNRTGTYYTSRIIVRAIIINSLNCLIQQAGIEDMKIEKLFQKKGQPEEKEKLIQLDSLVSNIRIADIACGAGVFLREGLDILFALSKELKNQLKENIKEETLLREIINKNLYGVDIQLDTVMLCRLLLLMKLDILLNRPLRSKLTLHIFHGDSLVGDDLRHLEGRFDMVIGNPPYIGERGNKAIFEAIKKTPFGQKYYEAKMDYFYFFLYRGWELLRPGGALGFITTNYFVTADGAQQLRNFIKNELNLYLMVNFNELKLFKGAQGQHNLILIGHKRGNVAGLPKPLTLITFKRIGNIDEKIISHVLINHSPLPEVEVNNIRQESIFDDRGQIMIQAGTDSSKILYKILKYNPRRLEVLFRVNQGIVSGADRLSVKNAEELRMRGQEGRGIFVLSEEEAEYLGITDSSLLKPFYKNSDIKQYHTLNKKSQFILYIDDQQELNDSSHAVIYQHLKQFKGLLEKRREVRLGRRKWYALQWPRNQVLFEQDKIVVPQRAYENSFAYVSKPWYASADVYYLTQKTTEISYYAMTALLNSALIYYWLFFCGKRKGESLELYSTPLKAIPIPSVFKPGFLGALEELAKDIEHQVAAGSHYEEQRNKIDSLVYDMYQLTEEERNQINSFMKGRKK